MSTRTIGKVLYTLVLALGLAGSASGCDVINKLKGEKSSDAKKDKDKDEDEDEDDDSSKKKSASAEPSASASAAPSATASASASAEASASASAEPSASAEASADAAPSDEDEVVRYPDEQVASGDYYTKKNFTVYKAADTTSKELGKVATGTLIELVAAHGGSWLLVKWPSGIGELSLGWLQVEQRQTTIQQTQDKPDAALKPPPSRLDAGDAGRPTVHAPDGGRIPVVRPRVPHR